MPGVSGFLTEVYVGAYDWTTTLRSADPEASQDIADVSTFRVRGKQKLGLQDEGKASLEGVWSYSADAGVTPGPEEFWTGIFDARTETPLTIARDGGDLGDSCICMRFRTGSYKNISKTDDAIRFTVEVNTSQGGVDFGKVAKAIGAVTVDGTDSAVDLGLDLGAGRAYLHVFAKSGTAPTLDVTIEHSDDGATGWAAAASFAQVSAIGWQVIDIASLKQHVRVKTDVGGTSPSFNFAVAVCPRTRF